MEKVNHGFALSDVYTFVSNSIENSYIGKDVIKNLIENDMFIPKEGFLWDYKMMLENDHISIAKTVTQVTSFHNVYGGFIIYGVNETTKNLQFEPCGIVASSINQSTIRDAIKKYTGYFVDITLNEITYKIGDKDYIFGVMHIPKRKIGDTPLIMCRNGPENEKGKPLFSEGSIFIRVQDESRKAISRDDIEFVMGDRIPTFFRTDKAENDLVYVSHELPDSQIICQKFFGREKILKQLWEWMLDDFRYTKILAGDGGKGKTSIALEFCKQFVKNPPLGFRSIIWLSAKEKQFSGFSNTYFKLPDADFENFESFLKTICSKLGYLDSEINDSSVVMLRKMAKEGLSGEKTLIVVDNIDSVDDEDQRKIIENCGLFGSKTCRFLLTTRKNHAHSREFCISVPGFENDEFRQYVNEIVSRFSIKKPSDNEIEQLYAASNGSPLLTESIVRLTRLGHPYSEAIKEWKGASGEDARSAVLKKELNELSHDAKRLLLAATYFKSFSISELRQSVDFGNDKFSECMSELEKLFLFQETKIIDNESRYSISLTTSLMVMDQRASLAHDHVALEKRVHSLREKDISGKYSGNTVSIGKAINQAHAFLRNNNLELAIKTIDVELKRQSNHRDLLLMKGRCLFESKIEKNINESRKLFRKSYEKGQVKPILFQLWYEAEDFCQSIPGLIEVSDIAIRIIGDPDWIYKSARAYLIRSMHRIKSGDKHSAIEDLVVSVDKMSIAIKGFNGVQRQKYVSESYMINDYLFNLLNETDVMTSLSKYDIILKQVVSGDIRSITLNRAVQYLEKSAATKSKNISPALVSAISISSSKFIVELEKIATKEGPDRNLDIYRTRVHTLLESIQNLH